MPRSGESEKACLLGPMHTHGAEPKGARPLLHPSSCGRGAAGPAPACIEEFKQQLSRDLHDDCGQIITLLQLRLAMLQTALPPEDPHLKAQVLEVTQLVAHLSGHLHALCAELRSPVGPALGLVSGLRQLVAEAAGLMPDLQLEVNLPTENDHWPAAHQEALYHVCQEALTNALRHARARRIPLDLAQIEDALQLTVSDDGSGFDPGRQLLSQGLAGMRERLDLLGGSLQVESRAGAGTTVQGKVPLPEVRNE
jgi:signal transduction histidine kinase